MSRYSGGYDDEEAFPGQFALYESNLRRAFRGKKGREFLADLRAALEALPEHRLIEGALCTVGAERRKAELLAQAEAEKVRYDAMFAGKYGPTPLDTEVIDQLERQVEHDGEGVCAIGALLWHQKVKAGADPGEAFAGLPLVLGTEDGGLRETAALAAQATGVAEMVAWEVAYRNDEDYSRCTPEERWQKVIDWLDRELAVAA